MAESDPVVLAGLIWTWLDHLKAPTLKEQEINILFKGIPQESPISSNKSLRKLSERPNWTELDNVFILSFNILIINLTAINLWIH